MLLNYPPTFEPRALVKKIQGDLIGQEQVQHATELPADFWAPGLVKKIQCDWIGQEQVCEICYWTTGDLWAPGLVKKIQSDWICQKQVQDATELPADFCGLDFIKNIRGEPIPIQPDLCMLSWSGQPDLCVLFWSGQP